MGVEWLALLLPVILALLAKLLFKSKLMWWEVVGPIVVVAIVIAIMKIGMVKSLTDDVEYRTANVVKAWHYDAWNEYIHKTCSTTYYTGSGKNRKSHTRYYDCSYVKYHPERWSAETNADDQSFNIDASYYNNLVKFYGNEEFVEMNRHYHSIDGDAHASYWPNDFRKIIPIDYEDTYENRAQAAATLFHFNDLDSVHRKGLYNYPSIKGQKQVACIGCTKENNETLRKINAQYGKDRQIKVFVLIFKNANEEIAERQRRYWKGGNKNELVICMDSKSAWAKSFSWCDDKRLEAYSNHLFSNSDLTVRQKLYVLKDMIPANWKRKHFSDFAYIQVPLTDNQLIWIHIISVLVTVGCLWWGATNEFKEESDDYDPRKPWTYRK